MKELELNQTQLKNISKALKILDETNLSFLSEDSEDLNLNQKVIELTIPELADIEKIIYAKIEFLHNKPKASFASLHQLLQTNIEDKTLLLKNADAAEKKRYQREIKENKLLIQKLEALTNKYYTALDHLNDEVAGNIQKFKEWRVDNLDVKAFLRQNTTLEVARGVRDTLSSLCYCEKLLSQYVKQFDELHCHYLKYEELLALKEALQHSDSSYEKERTLRQKIKYFKSEFADRQFSLLTESITQLDKMHAMLNAAYDPAIDAFNSYINRGAKNALLFKPRKRREEGISHFQKFEAHKQQFKRILASDKPALSQCENLLEVFSNQLKLSDQLIDRLVKEQVFEKNFLKQILGGKNYLPTGINDEEELITKAIKAFNHFRELITLYHQLANYLQQTRLHPTSEKSLLDLCHKAASLFLVIFDIQENVFSPLSRDRLVEAKQEEALLANLRLNLEELEKNDPFKVRYQIKGNLLHFSDVLQGFCEEFKYHAKKNAKISDAALDEVAYALAYAYHPIFTLIDVNAAQQLGMKAAVLLGKDWPFLLDPRQDIIQAMHALIKEQDSTQALYALIKNNASSDIKIPLLMEPVIEVSAFDVLGNQLNNGKNFDQYAFSLRRLKFESPDLLVRKQLRQWRRYQGEAYLESMYEHRQNQQLLNIFSVAFEIGDNLPKIQEGLNYLSKEVKTLCEKMPRAKHELAMQAVCNRLSAIEASRDVINDILADFSPADEVLLPI
ncbi:MAG: hypothetical protein ACK4M7_03075, partial [Burkholderiales bacterium]